MTVRKLPGVNRWRVSARTGRNFGTYTSRAAAEKRLAQIEMFSRRRRWR